MFDRIAWRYDLLNRMLSLGADVRWRKRMALHLPPGRDLKVLDLATRVTLSRVLNGRAAVSPEMALRIEAWLGAERGGDARVWLAEQSAYDMWQAAQRFKDAPMHVQPAPAMA